MFKKLLMIPLVSILSLSMLVGCQSEAKKEAEEARNILVQDMDMEVLQEINSMGMSLDIYTDRDTVVIALEIDSWILESVSEYDLQEFANELALGTLEIKQELVQLGNDAPVRIIIKDTDGNEYISVKDGQIE